MNINTSALTSTINSARKHVEQKRFKGDGKLYIHYKIDVEELNYGIGKLRKLFLGFLWFQWYFTDVKYGVATLQQANEDI